jgi:hypothetical protein
VTIMPEDLKEPGAACCDLGIAAVISFHRDEAAMARRYLAAAVPYARRIGNRLIGPLALARSLDREHDGAPRDALAALTAGLNGNTEELEEMEDLLTDSVRLAMETGNVSTAQSLAGYAAALATGPAIPRRQANALYCRGLLNHDASCLIAGAKRYDDANRPLLHAKSLEAAAGEFIRTGNLDQARAAFAKATGIYAWLGATMDAARLTSDVLL